MRTWKGEKVTASEYSRLWREANPEKQKAIQERRKNRHIIGKRTDRRAGILLTFSPFRDIVSMEFKQSPTAKSSRRFRERREALSSA
jgi:hypothetical protein